MAAAKAILDETLHPLAASDDRLCRSLAIVDEHLVRALDAELTYRKAMGYSIADGDSPFSLEQFVERSGRLKKHFEAVLALDREAHPVDEQLHIWVDIPGGIDGRNVRVRPASSFPETHLPSDRTSPGSQSE
jgi:hypothetical protein